MDAFHITGLVASLASFLTLKLTGHSDVASDNALLSLASFFAGSAVRAKLPSESK